MPLFSAVPFLHTVNFVLKLLEYKFWHVLHVVACKVHTQIDEYLVWQIGQGLLKIFLQCPLKNNIGGDLSLVVEEKSSKLPIKTIFK